MNRPVPEKIRNAFGILHGKMKTMTDRVYIANEICRDQSSVRELDVDVSEDPDLKILHDTQHHFSVCLNAKVLYSVIQYS